jgi:PAS domain S-box-containing protein
MSAPKTDATTDPQDIIAALQQKLDTALSDKAALADALATRNSEFGERIEHQAATIDVLKAMSASPSDPQPVIDLICIHAQQLCNASAAAIYRLEGQSVALHGTYAGAHETKQSLQMWRAQFPQRLSRGAVAFRAILDRQIIHIRDVDADPELMQSVRDLGVKSIVAIPIFREGEVIGSISINSVTAGGFSNSQLELLKTFAEQAVIAITSAETYRALQTQTSDLQETLEYQTAISDVLKVISRSAFDLQPVLGSVLEATMRLCGNDNGEIFRLEDGAYRLAVARGLPLEYVEIERKAAILPGRETLVGRTALQAQPVQIYDAWTDPDYNAKEEARQGGARTMLGVPLLRDGVPVGVIATSRSVVKPFTDRQIELVRTFADQVVIAMENARLLTEQREALERQTAMAEVLEVINTSPGNLGPVIEAITDKAKRLTEAEFSGLFTYDGEFFPLFYTGGDIAMDPLKAEEGSALAELVAGAPLVHIPDVADTDAYRAGIPSRVLLVEVFRARTTLWIALRKDNALVGALAVHRTEVRPFTDKQIALLQNFAAQAVIAMENARLLTEQREALEQQTATAEVLQVINSSPGNLTPVFEVILERAHTVCDAPLGSLVLYDGEQLHAVATRGYPPEYETLVRRGFPPIPPFRQLVDGEPFVHFPDTATWPSASREEDDLMRRAAIEIASIRTALFVPLRKDAAVLGYISAQRQEKRPFDEKQIALLENFAAQAVIAMENARLLTEQQEALEQQTATAEVLQVINASPGNLAPVFEAMLEKALRLCGADFGVLWTYDGERIHAAAQRGISPAFAEYLTRAPHPVGPDNAHGRLLRGDEVVHIIDIREDEAYRSGDPMRVTLVTLGGGRTLLAVPLRKDDKFLGDFVIYRIEVRPFSDKQIALLQSFAGQAVIAMENARLLTEQRETLEQQTATAEVLQVVNASPGNLAPVFDAMLQNATDLCAAAFGILWTFDGEHYHAVAFRNVPSAYSEFLRDPPPATPLTPLGRIAAGEAFAQIADMADEAFAAGGPMFHRAVELGGFRTIVGVPLRKDAVLLGAITIYRQEVRPFSDKQIVLLQNFAAQAVVAMENARLLDEIRQRQEELHITFENMGDGVAMFDESQHLVAWNRKFQDILDVPDDIIARRQTYSQYVRYLAERGEFGSNPEEQVRQFVEQAGRSRTYERTRPDGRVIEVRHNPVPDGGFVLIFSDITERKRSEAELRAARDAAEEASRTIESAYSDLKAAQANLIQAEKMASLGQLTAGIAHEIKNPLNFVNNFAELSGDLLDELNDAVAGNRQAEIDEVTATLQGNLAKITEHGKRADGIVKAMLEHSRGSSGERRMVDLNALIDEALNLAYHGARAQDQSFNSILERDFAEGIAPIELVPQDMTRVLLNLFSNGFYAATRRARIGADAGFMPMLKVTTIDAGEAVEIHVRDNGIGISADIRDKLFQPFFTTKPTGEGTGLGLSITYDIVTQQHGGTITVDSKVGEYSEFLIRLPRSP